MLVPIGVCFYFYKQRHRAFYYVMVFSTLKFIKDTFKLFYHDPRPFWVYTDIKSFRCSTSYGNPSGHAMETSGMLMTVFLDYCRYYTNSEDYLSRVHMKVLFFFLFLIITFGEGFATLYLG